jgi:hypothetical protein
MNNELHQNALSSSLVSLSTTLENIQTPQPPTWKAAPGPLKKALLVGALALGAVLAMPTEAHAGIFGVFDEIFGTIKGPIGGALSDINAIARETQQLYQTTMWPLALINHARGFVSNRHYQLSRLYDERVHRARSIRNPEQPAAARNRFT